MITLSDVFELAILSLASGRIAYSLAMDEIFRPLREWVWLRSAPDAGSITLDDRELPARMVHRYRSTPGELLRGAPKWNVEFDAASDLRSKGFFGQLIECPYCLTFWTSLAALAALAAFGDAAVIAALPFAVWAVANTYAAKGL